MKYIRTKTYIYVKPDETCIEGNKVAHFAYRPEDETIIGFRAYIEYEDIIKEADNVEELCDWFAFEGAFDAKLFGPDFFSSISLARLYAKESKRKVVGYIGVERKGTKALEPVAKSNEKGEFELL